MQGEKNRLCCRLHHPAHEKDAPGHAVADQVEEGAVGFKGGGEGVGDWC